MEELGRRKGDLQDMQPDGRGRTRLEYLIPARGLIGFQNEFLTLTRGTGLMSHIFHEYAPIKEGSIGERRNGVLISQDNGDAVAYALRDRGRMFVNPGEALYEGMIIGIHSRDNDLVVNPIKGKQLTNVRASGTDEAVRLVPPIQMSLEYAVEFIDDDELVELTPVDPPAQALPATSASAPPANRRCKYGAGPGPRCASRVGRGRENALDRSGAFSWPDNLLADWLRGPRLSRADAGIPASGRHTHTPRARIDHVYIRALVQLAQDAPEGIVDILDVARASPPWCLVSSVTLMSRWKAFLPSSDSACPPMNHCSRGMYCSVMAMTGSFLPSTDCVRPATDSTTRRLMAGSGWPDRWTTMWAWQAPSRWRIGSERPDGWSQSRCRVDIGKAGIYDLIHR